MEFKTFNEIYYDHENCILLRMLYIKKLQEYNTVKTVYM